MPPWASSGNSLWRKIERLAGRLDFLFGFASERRDSLHLDQERFAYVRVAVRDRLDRLTWHFDWSLTQLVEELAARAERAFEADVSGAALEAYRDAGYEDETR